MAGLSPKYQLIKGTGHRQQSQTRDLARKKVQGSPGLEMSIASRIGL